MKEKAHRNNVEEEYTKVTTTAEFKSEFKYSHMDTIKKYSVEKHIHSVIIKEGIMILASF